MADIWGRREERMYLMFKKISSDPHASADELLQAANGKYKKEIQKNEGMLLRVCGNHIIQNFGYLVKSIQPYGVKDGDSDPDLVVQIKDSIKTSLMWMRGMDIPVKILSPNSSIKYEESAFFKKALEMVIIIRMDEKTSSGSFNANFETELTRINKIVDGSNI